MHVKVNGKQVEKHSASLIELLESEGVDTTQSGIAVALNDDVVPRSLWNETTLSEGDVIEIITAMQGG